MNLWDKKGIKEETGEIDILQIKDIKEKLKEEIVQGLQLANMRFPACPWHKIYRVEEVGLYLSNAT